MPTCGGCKVFQPYQHTTLRVVVFLYFKDRPNNITVFKYSQVKKQVHRKKRKKNSSAQHLKGISDIPERNSRVITELWD